MKGKAKIMIYKKIQLDNNDENVYLEIYVADALPGFTRNAILVIPGGGYGAVCSDREGEPIAMAFLPYGYNSFVLHYSVSSNSDKTFPTQLIQASMAMKHIRDHAEEYNIVLSLISYRKNNRQNAEKRDLYKLLHKIKYVQYVFFSDTNKCSLKTILRLLIL